MELVLGLGIFFTTAFLLEGIYSVYRKSRMADANRVKRRLRTLSAGGYENPETSILKKKVLSEVPWLNRLLLSLPRAHKLDRVLDQANVRQPVGVFLILSLTLGLATAGAVSAGTHNGLLSVASALVVGTAPLLFILKKKRKRMEKFLSQFPDALDLIARSLKAGHALTGGLRMVAEEFEDPVGPEFEKTLDQINFGIAPTDALRNLAQRVDCEDLNYFVISVIVQRETGGNLAEILQKIAHLIRERFKFFGRVKVLSAEGKFSAVVLILLPIVVAAALSVVNPEYLPVLVFDPVGRMLLIGALFNMGLAVLYMKKIVTIKV
jgi:tight adherence protein B